MANLRADNLTGTGGRNAIDGSVAFLGDKDALQVPAGSDFAYGTGDFTIEAWIRPQGVTSGEAKGIFCQTQSGNDYVKFFINSDKTVKATFGSDTITGGMVEAGSWSHVAVTRASNTVKVFVNGVASSGTSVTTDFTDTTRKPTIGQYTHSFGTLEYYGYISNFHIVKGTALYTTDFTPSTSKLTAVDGTVLLCCQDSDDPTQEATGKTITGYANLNRTASELTAGELTSSNYSSAESDWSFSNGVATVSMSSGGYESLGSVESHLVNGQLYELVVNVTTFNAGKITFGQANAGNADFTIALGRNVFRHVYSGTTQDTGGIGLYARDATGGGYAINLLSLKQVISGKAPKVLPPYGIDEGVVIDGYTKINSPGVMYFPTGDTSQRGRGTALFGGGYQTPNSITAIDYLSIQSGGLTQEWGNLSTTALASGAACSSYTRWVTGGGWTGANNNAIEYVTFTTQGNSLEFGDLVVGRRNTAAVANSTRGIWGGGYISPADAGTDSMDYITIASTGNAADFGNLSAASKSGGVAGSTTRAVWALGLVAPADNNTLEYVTIATTGNVTNFGDMPSGSNGRDVSGCSSNVRGIYGGGQYPTEVNIINYITIATTGDAVDFGDLTLARGQTGATSNGIRGVFMGGTTNPARVDNIDSVIIATTGNAVNWGDFRTAKTGLNSAASDSHGGLS